MSWRMRAVFNQITVNLWHTWALTMRECIRSKKKRHFNYFLVSESTPTDWELHKRLMNLFCLWLNLWIEKWPTLTICLDAFLAICSFPRWFRRNASIEKSLNTLIISRIVGENLIAFFNNLFGAKIILIKLWPPCLPLTKYIQIVI